MGKNLKMGMIKHYILIDTILTKNKCFNFEIGKDTDWDMYDLFHIEFQWTYKADHAGPRFSISIGKYYNRRK